MCILVCCLLLCKVSTLLLMMLWTAPGVLYVKIAGMYVCFDVLLHQWLTYFPSRKQATDSTSGVDRLEVTVDVGIAQATLPITSATSQGSFCCSQLCYFLTYRMMQRKPLPLATASKRSAIYFTWYYSNMVRMWRVSFTMNLITNLPLGLNLVS